MENPLSQLPIPLLGWYQTHARDLPWRREVTPYRVWVSEIMLQQTRVAAVVGLFRNPCTCPDLDSHFAGAGVG